MTSAEDLIELSDDDLHEIVEKYKESSMNLCFGGSPESFAAFGNILRVGHLNKDLELEGMQIGCKLLTNSNFFQCTEQVFNSCRRACLGVPNCFSTYKRNAPVIYFVEEYLETSDMSLLQKRYSRYEQWASFSQNTLDAFGEAKRLAAEIYACYIITRGPSYDQVIEALGAVRRELMCLEATWLYFSSLLTPITELLDQICTNDSDNIVDILKQNLGKFHIHSTFFTALSETQSIVNEMELLGGLEDLYFRPQSVFNV